MLGDFFRRGEEQFALLCEVSQSFYLPNVSPESLRTQKGKKGGAIHNSRHLSAVHPPKFRLLASNF